MVRDKQANLMNEFHHRFAVQWTAGYLFVDIVEQSRKICELIKAAFNIMLLAGEIKTGHSFSAQP